MRRGGFGSLFRLDLADLEHTLKYLGLDAKQVMVSGVTACLGGVESVFQPHLGVFWQISYCFRMPVIIPTACYSWEFGQGNGKRFLSNRRLLKRVSGLNLYCHSSGLGLEDRRRFLRKKKPKQTCL